MWPELKKYLADIGNYPYDLYVTLTTFAPEIEKEIKKMLLTGVSKDKIAEQFNVCRATVYNFVRKNPELLMENAR
jgi:DNA-binding NarL/FixJ family response regulator